MKAPTTLLLAFLLFTACAPAPEADVHRVVVHSEAPELTLNLGARWQTDDYTDVGVRVLQEAAWKFNGNTHDAYRNLGRELEGVIVQLFKNTTMQGEANDMLHVLLMPIAQDVAVLERRNLNEARAAQQRIAARLNLYEQYFQ